MNEKTVKNVQQDPLAERNRMRSEAVAQAAFLVPPAETTDASMDAHKDDSKTNEVPWEVEAMEYFKSRLDTQSVMLQVVTQKVSELTKVANDLYDAVEQVNQTLMVYLTDEDEDEDESTERSEVRAAQEEEEGMRGYSSVYSVADEVAEWDKNIERR